VRIITDDERPFVHYGVRSRIRDTK